MSRKCIRCNTEMVENCVAETEDVYKIFTHIFIYKKANSALKQKVGTMDAAVCPNCGEISFYLGDVSKL